MNQSKRDFIKKSIVATTGVSVSLLSFPNILEAGINDDLVLIKNKAFMLGSPENEFLRENDEKQYKIVLPSFYMSKYPVTQQEYKRIMGNNPSTYIGEDLPVHDVTWYDAINYCNALSKNKGLTPAYTVADNKIIWNQNADGYRLPTESEWEYATRAGTDTPFYTGKTISTKDANYYGTYPYYYDEKSGRYLQKPVKVGSYAPNQFGLYDMAGNIWQWCWDWYGEYEDNAINPTGPNIGCYKVHRGGAWNDFARHLRSAYRAATVPYNKLYNIGFRVVRSSAKYDNEIISYPHGASYDKKGKSIVVYFSWSGNTERLAKAISEIVKCDIVKIEMETPYSSNYSTCLKQSRSDQEKNVRPKIKEINISNYSNIFLGYPTWWATMPMPVWSFLYNNSNRLENKRIIPFASHGEGRLAQTLSAISKNVNNTTVAEAFSIMYSDLSKDKLNKWISRIMS